MNMQVTVDVILFTLCKKELQVLLIRRGIPPFQGEWAIPGGFVLPKESLEEAALRELSEETQVSNVYLEQLYSFGEPNRDPRGRVITVAYYALLKEKPQVQGGSDAKEAAWWPLSKLPHHLAFDHAHILQYALTRMRNKVWYTPIAFELLPEEFTLIELQEAYEAILGYCLDKRNFRRKLALTHQVKPLEKWRLGRTKPAQLYQRLEKNKFEIESSEKNQAKKDKKVDARKN